MPTYWQSILLQLPAKGWAVVRDVEPVHMHAMELCGYIKVQVVSPDTFQARLTSAGREYRKS
jgi:hypothetical protein